jgi:hypothetical protein
VIAEDRGFPDHFPVFIETVLDKPQDRKKTVSYRSIKRIDPVALKTAISHSHLADINSDLPLEKQVCLYDSVLGAILNEMAPLKTKTITSRTDAEWYNEQIREAKQGRRRAERRWRGSQLQVDKEIFIEHRHKVNELIDVSKRDYYRNLITSCSDSKQLFRVLNQLLGRKREAQPPEKTPLVLAEMFSQFFIEKISDIRDSIPDANDPTPPFPSPACSFTQFAPVSVTDVLKLIASSPTKSCSLDPLPTELIKANKNELAPAICSIINISLFNGVFPAVYQNALIRPLL